MSPRLREFNEEKVLNSAVKLFWTKGYNATSMADLLRHMKLSRQSLYNTFGGKHKLYLSALDHYYEHAVQSLVVPLESEDASIHAIREFYSRFLKFISSSSPRKSCMMINAAGELAAVDKEVGERVRKYFERLNSAFHNALVNAHRRHEISFGHDPAAISLILVTCVTGLSMLSKSGISTKVMKGIIDNTIRELL